MGAQSRPSRTNPHCLTPRTNPCTFINRHTKTNITTRPNMSRQFSRQGKSRIEAIKAIGGSFRTTFFERHYRSPLTILRTVLIMRHEPPFPNEYYLVPDDHTDTDDYDPIPEADIPRLDDYIDLSGHSIEFREEHVDVLLDGQPTGLGYITWDQREYDPTRARYIDVRRGRGYQPYDSSTVGHQLGPCLHHILKQLTDLREVMDTPL